MHAIQIPFSSLAAYQEASAFSLSNIKKDKAWQQQYVHTNRKDVIKIVKIMMLKVS